MELGHYRRLDANAGDTEISLSNDTLVRRDIWSMSVIGRVHKADRLKRRWLSCLSVRQCRCVVVSIDAVVFLLTVGVLPCLFEITRRRLLTVPEYLSPPSMFLTTVWDIYAGYLRYHRRRQASGHHDTLGHGIVSVKLVVSD